MVIIHPFIYKELKPPALKSLSASPLAPKTTDKQFITVAGTEHRSMLLSKSDAICVTFYRNANKSGFPAKH